MGEFIRSNPNLDRDLFGKWIEIVERVEKQKQINKEHYDSKQPRREEERATQKEGEVMQTDDEHEHEQPNNTDPLQSVEGETTSQTQTQEQTETEILPEPKQSEFNLPETDEAINEVIARLMEFGMSKSDAVANIEKRKKLYSQAMKKHMSITTRAAKKNRPLKNKKESFNDK